MLMSQWMLIWGAALLLLVLVCEAKYGGDKPEPRRRRCLNGSPPKRLKKRHRRLQSLEPGDGCRALYPRLSCCAKPDGSGLLIDPKIFSVTNNTECAKILDEIRCAHCSPHAQTLFHPPEQVDTYDRQLVLPILCKDYCKEFYYTCRGQIPGLLQTTADDFCFHHGVRDSGPCFPDFPRKKARGPASNYLDLMEDYDKVEEIGRFISSNAL